MDQALAQANGGRLDELTAPQEARHPGKSAFRLLKEGPEAFAVRVESARLAAHSLDVQTYIWHGDATGLYLAAKLLDTADRGARVRILTNSLSANDVAAVHGGYSRYRQQLLEGGAQIWELKPLAGGGQEASIFGSSGASLHTKAFAADARIAFVGSYNLDPRSTLLNCEQGVLVEDETIARELIAIFDKQTRAEHAWKVSVSDGKLSWSDGTATFKSDPEASFSRKIQAWFARTFRLDALL